MAFRNHAYGRVGEKTKRVRKALGDLETLCKEDPINAHAALALSRAMKDEFANDDDVFVKSAISLLDRIAQDGQIDPEERALVLQLVQTYERPVSEEPVIQVSQKRFVLSGDFSLEGGKSTAKDMIKAEGGIVTGSVSGRTDYVVVGDKGNAAWAFGSFGSKIKKALDLRLSGKSHVMVVSEGALLSYFVENSEEAMRVLEEKTERYRKQWEQARTVGEDFEGLTAGQQRVFDLVKDGRNVYLTGLGGTGKSYVLDKIIAWSRTAGKNVIVCAPTGIAALNVGGSTLHRALRIGPDTPLQSKSPRVKDDSPFLECDLLIIDEISMCRMDLFDYLSSVLRICGALRMKKGEALCQLVVVGDFCQLPPVITQEERPILESRYRRDVGHGYPFLSDSWNYWHFEKVELTEAIRQRDATFVAALNATRVGDVAGVRWIQEHAAKETGEHAIILCGTNRQANAENAKRLDALVSREHTYKATVKGEVDERDMATSRSLTLRPGARVMALVNNSEKTYMNGTLGTVVSCRPTKVIVNFDGTGVAVVERHEWNVTRPILANGKTKTEVVGSFEQIPLKLAWAITIHKSQGQTFESALVYPDCWEAGQLYTALSRLTSIDGLCLAHDINDDSLVTSPDVLEFLEQG